MEIKRIVLIISLATTFGAFGDNRIALERYGEPMGTPKGTACIAKDPDGEYFVRWDKSKEGIVTFRGGILRNSSASACAGTGSYSTYWVAPRWYGKNRFQMTTGGDWVLMGPNLQKKDHLWIPEVEASLDDNITLLFRPTKPISLTLNNRLTFICDGGCGK